MTDGVINPRAVSYQYDWMKFACPVLRNNTIRALRSVKEMRKVAGHLLLVERREVKTG